MDGTNALTRLGIITLVAGTMAACGTGPVAGPAASMRILQNGGPSMADSPTAPIGGIDQASFGQDRVEQQDELPALDEQPADIQDEAKDDGIQLKGELNEEQAKLYAKGFKDGFYDCTRAHRAEKERQKALKSEAKFGRYAEVKRLGAADVYVPDKDDAAAPKPEPSPEAPATETIQIADEE